MARRYEPRHAKARDGAGAEDSLAVGTAQGQPDAGVEGEPGDAHPEQADALVTGGEALEEQQRNPDLDDTGGAHP